MPCICHHQSTALPFASSFCYPVKPVGKEKNDDESKRIAISYEKRQQKSKKHDYPRQIIKPNRMSKSTKLQKVVPISTDHDQYIKKEPHPVEFSIE